MNETSIVPLHLLMRIEPGCLGPNGPLHVKQFCQFATAPFNRLGGQAIHWALEPRFDKTLPEVEYYLNDHKLTHVQAERYLQMSKLDLKEQEQQASDLLSELIDVFFEEPPKE
ncbi:MAG: hypothetical protein CENE_01160 [Candidatus Celerinatantimonas neptuna]|nr:MAG: hypothetical protein CENE_01160 [Candidatus Celerinatantimonas neptuna]